MFRLLERARYGGAQVRWGYGGEPVEFDPDASPLPLDPIDPELVGKVHVSEIMAWAKRERYQILAETIAAITEERPDVFEGVTQKGKGPVINRKKYKEHLDALCAVRLPENAREKITFFSSYFAVQKGERHSRSIFNGKRLSEACAPPPPVNLISSHELLGLIHRTIPLGTGAVYAISGDLRHWFHQIPASKRLQKLFGLRTEEMAYVWRCLPMGWSWSPAVAQALAWAFLSFHRPGESPIFDTSAFQGMGTLPRWINLKNGLGIATVYYDNFLIIVRSQNDRDQVLKRLHRNADALHVVLKGEILVQDRNALQTEGLRHLGMHIKIDDEAMHVRPLKIDQWAELARPKTGATIPCRMAAEYIGRAVFAACLQADNLRRTGLGRLVIECARSVGGTVFRSSWNDDWKVPRSFTEMWDMVLGSQDQPFSWTWKSDNQPRARSLMVVTDASDSGWGYIVGEWKLDRFITFRVRRGRWEVNDNRHIFLKELDAALRAVASVKAECNLVVVGDNVAVSWALRQGYTRNAIGLDMISKGETQRITEVITVISADNPADSPSRGRPVDPERVKKLEVVLRGRDRGEQRSSEPRSQWTSEERQRQIRHEGPREECVFEDCDSPFEKLDERSLA